MTKSAVEAFRKLQKPEAQAVADALNVIGKVAANALLPGADQKQYMIIAPVDPRAPAIIYRKLDEDEGEGYLVTALVARSTYNAYERADRESGPESSFWKTIASALGPAGLAALFGSRLGRGEK